MASKDTGHKEKKRAKKDKAKKPASLTSVRAPMPEPERRGRTKRDRD